VYRSRLYLRPEHSQSHQQVHIPRPNCISLTYLTPLPILPAQPLNSTQTVLTGTTVGKLILTTTTSTPRATSVQYRDSTGKTYILSARLEIIMATGSIKTPVILQQSGIGPAGLLSSVGVAGVVDLPVGMNLIDQTTTTTDWGFSGARGGGQPILFPRFQVGVCSVFSHSAPYFPPLLFRLHNASVILESRER
jgi:choline dehydrogenase-like flavoprotein